MPSNKQKDLQKKIEKTGKDQIVFHAVSICPAIEKGEIIFKIMEIGFTENGECVSIEEVNRSKNEASAINQLQVAMIQSGAMDIRHIRKLVKQVKEDYESKKAAK